MNETNTIEAGTAKAPAGSSPETGSATRVAGPDQATHTIPPQSCRSATKPQADPDLAEWLRLRAVETHQKISGLLSIPGISKSRWQHEGERRAYAETRRYLELRLPKAPSDESEGDPAAVLREVMDLLNKEAAIHEEEARHATEIDMPREYVRPYVKRAAKLRKAAKRLSYLLP